MEKQADTPDNRAGKPKSRRPGDAKKSGLAAWAKNEMEEACGTECGTKSEKPRDAALQVVDIIGGPCRVRTYDPLIIAVCS